jgi:hypothetical protein
VDDGNEPRGRANGLADVFGVDDAGDRIDRNVRVLNAAVGGEMVIRAEHGVVVHPRGDAMIAGREHALDGEVQGVGAIEREDEMIGILAVEERVKPLAAGADHFCGGLRLGIRPAAGGGADLRGIVDHRLEHFGRLGKTGGGVVAVKPSRGGNSAGDHGILLLCWVF